MERIRIGTVKEVTVMMQSGIIVDSLGKEYFFHLNECVDGELPKLGSQVTFIKDTDYKTTNVASLVKPSQVG